MHVTGVPFGERSERLRQIHRLTNSAVLHNSESLCKLLRYLADHTVDQPGLALKEYQIATEVFGRAQDFDPKVDATVRVQTGRLRAKIVEYYAGEGANDPIVVEVPKGSYTLTFRHRVESAPVPANVRPPVIGMEAPAEPPRAVPVLVGLWLVTLTVAAVMGGLWWRERSRAPEKDIVAPPAALATLWRGFSSTEPPLVIYSNAEFVGRPETGMRYRNPVRDQGRVVLDHYTGVGEVIAILELERLFRLFNIEARVRRGRLLSYDDAKDSNLVFVGSPTENLSLRDLPGPKHFAFRTVTNGPRKGDLSIVNLQPRYGEQGAYLASPDTPLREDYALIALTPGINPARWVYVLAGTTTLGTQAAVEFVCHQQGAEQLLKQLNSKPPGPRPQFEAILQVQVSKGVPVQSQLVAVHKTAD